MNNYLRHLYLLIYFISFCCSACKKPDAPSVEIPVIPEEPEIEIPGYFDLHIEEFYYGFDEKIYLKTRENKMLICYSTEKRAQEGIADLEKLFPGVEFQVIAKSNPVINTNSKYSLNDIIDQLKTQKGVRFIKPVYALADTDFEMILINEFLVKFKPEVSEEKIDSLNNRYAVQVKERANKRKSYFVPDSIDVLSVANAWQESGLTVFSCPNFYVTVILEP